MQCKTQGYSIYKNRILKLYVYYKNIHLQYNLNMFLSHKNTNTKQHYTKTHTSFEIHIQIFFHFAYQIISGGKCKVAGGV